MRPSFELVLVIYSFLSQAERQGNENLAVFNTSFLWICINHLFISCSFHCQAEQQGNPLPYTLQCVLPLNLYNDKFFAIFTIVYPILLIISFITMVQWIWVSDEQLIRALNHSFIIMVQWLWVSERYSSIDSGNWWTICSSIIHSSSWFNGFGQVMTDLSG